MCFRVRLLLNQIIQLIIIIIVVIVVDVVIIAVVLIFYYYYYYMYVYDILEQSHQIFFAIYLQVVTRLN